MRSYLIISLLFFWLFPASTWAEVIRGMYGVTAKGKIELAELSQHLERAGINAVFVPPDGNTIRTFKERGFKVYLSLNVFGGTRAWKRFPSSRPVKADGQLLGSGPGYKGHGGVCPTHPGWRAERLKRIRDLVEQFGGQERIDGLWLDCIRYPGLWEVEDPRVPDTCYCPRCLKKFQRERHVELPAGLKAEQAAIWINKNCPSEWMQWKKEQILSFVSKAKEILGRLTLGLFLVPWTRGEKHCAISYGLAQDAFQLSRLADVISPMLYHRMCGKPPSWVGRMVRYYKEGAGCALWPIVQSMDCSREGFGQVLTYAGQAGADGVLVFSFKGMKSDLWDGIGQFRPLINLIPNPEFKIPEGSKWPEGWKTGASECKRCPRSSFHVKPADDFMLRDGASGPDRESRCIGVRATHDQAGEWYCGLPECEPGAEYVFTAQLYRAGWENGVYPTISLWGQGFYIDNHWLTRIFQPIRLYVRCPDKCHDLVFRFVNHNPGKTFWLTEPSLTNHYTFRQKEAREKRTASFYDRFFPIGVYGADLRSLEEIKKLAINTVLIGGHGRELGKMIRACHRLGFRYVLSVPRDPERLHLFLNEIEHLVQPWALAFYVNDEPGIHSFPINRANDLNRLIKERFPRAATCMAVVRPGVCRDYLEASDFFMMDQYPVPSMPMSWLSDSMDQASEWVGRDRIASVIQAFGGKRWADVGWPRLPTWQEMDCLAFLSIVHGSRGIFFFTFKETGKTAEGQQRLARVVGRLNRLYPWLLERNLDERVAVEMISPYRVDPKGSPAVHCCLKKKGDQLLLLAVNTIGTHVEAAFQLRDSAAHECGEAFSGERYPIIKGRIRTKFTPFETKAFLLGSLGGNIISD